MDSVFAFIPSIELSSLLNRIWFKYIIFRSISTVNFLPMIWNVLLIGQRIVFFCMYAAISSLNNLPFTLDHNIVTCQLI